jgi:hypothetical protein
MARIFESRKIHAEVVELQEIILNAYIVKTSIQADMELVAQAVKFSKMTLAFAIIVNNVDLIFNPFHVRTLQSLFLN